MNIRRDIADRALEAAGQERLTDEDISNNSSRWRLIKDNYLAVILSTLEKTSWSGRIRRARLTESDEENLGGFAFMYSLPPDCAKPDSLLSGEIFITEGKAIYTDDADPVLVYVSSGYRGKPEDGDPALEEDYPEYDDFAMDANLSEYTENQLAARIALKLTGDQSLYQLLFSKAVLIEDRARKANLEIRHSQEKGEQWWGDRMGLSVEGR